MRVPQIESVPVATAMAWLCSWYSHFMGTSNVDEILPARLWLGNLAIAWDRAALKAIGITHIVSVTQFGSATAWYPDEFEYLCVDAQDEEGVALNESFARCNAFLTAALDTPGAKVLVHCNQGRSRSVAVTAAFLISQFGWTVDDAVGFIRESRPEADPNAGFLEQLHAFQYTVCGEEKNNPSL